MEYENNIYQNPKNGTTKKLYFQGINKKLLEEMPIYLEEVLDEKLYYRGRNVLESLDA